MFWPKHAAFTIFCQNKAVLAKTQMREIIFFGPNGFPLGIATQNCVFLAEIALVWQKYADLMSQMGNWSKKVKMINRSK